MKILISGRFGQVGWEVQRAVQCLGDVVALDRRSFDLLQPQSLERQLETLQPDVVVNAAAYTAVDTAEREEEVANTINGSSVGVLARWAARRGSLLVHYSTDYVFDGNKSFPYLETDEPKPINAYGRSKLLGENEIRRSGCHYLLLRTTWVFSSRGKNFLRTMLRIANQQKEISVVADQLGAPTWSRTIADVTAHLIRDSVRRRSAGEFSSQVFNLTSSGSTTWFHFAEAIFAEAASRGILATDDGPTLRPVSSKEYMAAAKRPAYSVLDLAKIKSNFGVALPPWQESLRLCLDEIKAS